MPAPAMRDRTSLPYRLVRGACRLLLRAYYPDLVVEGADRVPDGPVIVAANHPNSLVDPVLVSVFMPRKIHWLAKHTLFGNPVSRSLLTALGAIPVKRRHEGGDRSSSDEVIRVAAEALTAGKAIGIFPEGRSHDDDQFGALKTGAGRMAVLAARDLAASQSAATVRVAPVMLHFSSKARFRTGALVHVAEALDVSPHDTPEEVTARLRAAMSEVMVHVDDSEQQHLLRDVRVLIRRRAALDPMHSDPREVHRADRATARAIRRFHAEEPERLRAFASRLRAYVEALERKGLSVHSLEEVREPVMRRWTAMALLPIGLWGALHSIVPYRLTRAAGRKAARSTDRTMIALCTLATGAVLFPLFWLAEALAVGHFWGTRAAVLFLITAPITGLVARWTFHVLHRQLGRIGDALLIAAHPRAVERLRAERAWLWSEIDRWQSMLDGPP